MRVIYAPANFARPLVAVDISETGDVTPFGEVSRYQMIVGLEGRKMFDPVHIYLGQIEETLSLENVVTVRQSDTLDAPENAPSAPLMMEVETKEFWAAVGFLSTGLEDGEEVALVLPDGIPSEKMDGLTPRLASLLSADGTPQYELPAPRLYAQGELLLWDWFAKTLDKQLGVDIDEARIAAGDESKVAILVPGSDDGHRVLTRYSVAVDDDLETQLTISRENDPQTIEGDPTEIDGAWDRILIPEKYSADGAVTLPDGEVLGVASGLFKRGKMQPRVANGGGG